jgi:hypothetical protein
MKVIFLDIDGVLNVDTSGRDEYGARFNKHFVRNLSHILTETKAKIVISSSWRKDGNIEEIWKARNLPGEIVGQTPIRWWHPNRGEEIAEWLSQNPVKSYVILDDEDVEGELLPNFVRCCDLDDDDAIDYHGSKCGLTKRVADEAIKILGKGLEFETFGS